MTRLSRSKRNQIRQRANNRCEYCCLPETFSFQPFQVDHILAVKHGGSDELDNTTWGCADCNNAKGSDIASYDQETGALTPFYNPRSQKWDEHFEIRDGVIVGKTPVGRVTVRLLQMNRIEQVEVRRLLIENGLWD